MEVIKIDSRLDVKGSNYITKLLYLEVAQGNIKFRLESKEGSVGLSASIDVLRNLYNNLSVGDLIAVFGLGAYLTSKIYKWMKKEKDEGRHYKSVKIKTTTKEITITGNERSIKEIKIKEIKEDFQKNEF